MEGIHRLAVEEEEILLQKAPRDGRKAVLASAVVRRHGTVNHWTWLQKGNISTFRRLEASVLAVIPSSGRSGINSKLSG